MTTSSRPKLIPFKYLLSIVAVLWVIAWWMGTKSTLACTRGSDRSAQCKVTDASLFGTDRALKIPLTDIQKVDVVADREDNDDGEEPGALMVLVTNNQQVAIGSAGDYAAKDKLAAQVAWFLEDTQATTFNLTEGDLILPWCLIGGSTLLLINYLYQLYRSRRLDAADR